MKRKLVLTCLLALCCCALAQNALSVTITSPDNISVYQGVGGSLQVTVSGADGSEVFSLLDTVPAGVSIDAMTGLMTIDSSVGAGIYVFTVYVESNSGNVYEYFRLAVRERTPSITSADNFSVVHGASGTFAVTASGISPITFSLSGNPAEVTIDANTGIMTIAPTLAVGTYPMGIIATNGSGTDTQSFTLTITEKPTPSSGGGGIAEPEPEPVQMHQKATVANCNESANIRALPSTDAEIIGEVLAGETIELLKWDASGSWCKVLYSGGNHTGWLHGQFIQ